MPRPTGTCLWLLEINDFLVVLSTLVCDYLLNSRISREIWPKFYQFDLYMGTVKHFDAKNKLFQLFEFFWTNVVSLRKNDNFQFWFILKTFYQFHLYTDRLIRKHIRKVFVGTLTSFKLNLLDGIACYMSCCAISNFVFDCCLNFKFKF